MYQTKESPRIKVMIAEDHVHFRTVVREFLCSKPEIDFMAEAANGHELLQLLTVGTPDVVLLGIRMPVLDGSSTLSLIKKRYPLIKVIILSLSEEHHLIGQMMTEGAYAYLSKTTEVDTIYQTISGCVEDLQER